MICIRNHKPDSTTSSVDHWSCGHRSLWTQITIRATSSCSVVPGANYMRRMRAQRGVEQVIPSPSRSQDGTSGWAEVSGSAGSALSTVATKASTVHKIREESGGNQCGGSAAPCVASWLSLQVFASCAVELFVRGEGAANASLGAADIEVGGHVNPPKTPLLGE